MAARLRIAIATERLSAPVRVDIASLGKALFKPVWSVLQDCVDDDLEIQPGADIQDFDDLLKIV